MVLGSFALTSAAAILSFATIPVSANTFQSSSASFGRGRPGHLNEWWRCTSSWDKDCEVTKIDVRISEPVQECSTVNLDWSSKVIPEPSGLTYYLTAQINLTSTEGAKGSALPAQDFVTPETSFKWNGTKLYITLDAYRKDQYFWAETANFTVGEGVNNSTCVPLNHTPVVYEFPEELVECSIPSVSWSGGEGPFQVYMEAGHLGTPSFFASIWPGQIFDGETTTAQLTMFKEFEGGAFAKLSIMDQSWNVLASKKYTIKHEAGGRTCPLHNDYKIPRWYRLRGVRIAAFVVGGLIAAIGLGVAGYFGFVWYKKTHSEGQIALPQ